jgi:hypothetical protein
MNTRIASLVCGLFLAGPASADTAEALLAKCDKLDRTLTVQGDNVTFAQNPGSMYCWGYLGALEDVSILSVTKGSNPLLQVCLPPGSTRTTLLRVFTEYARKNPAQLKLSAADVVVSAFR